MTSTAENLKPTLDALEVDDRIELADYLLSTIDPDHQARVDAAWHEEILRRSSQIDRGEVEGVPAEVVFERMRAKYP